MLSTDLENSLPFPSNLKLLSANSQFGSVWELLFGRGLSLLYNLLNYYRFRVPSEKGMNQEMERDKWVQVEYSVVFYSYERYLFLSLKFFHHCTKAITSLASLMAFVMLLCKNFDILEYLFTKRQIFGLGQIQSNCRRQFKHCWNGDFWRR